MSIVKVIEVIAESTDSWDDAARRAVAEAAITVKNIKHLYVKELQAIVEDSQIVKYRLNANVSFVVDHRFDHGNG